MRKEVRIFADCMEHKLRKNDHKGGWEKQTNEQLFKLLRGEVDELEAALKDEPALHVVFEAADIANFAMMIAWNALRQMVQPEVKDDDRREQGKDRPDPTMVHRSCPHN